MFDAAGVSFVSVTQQFNTTTSMGRLTLNVLLSFAQFEREVIADQHLPKVNPTLVALLCKAESARVQLLRMARQRRAI